MNRLSVIGIPGLWKDRTSFVTSVADFGEGLLFAGMILHDSATEMNYEVELTPHDPAFRRAFEIASQGKADKSLLESISHHTFVAYIISQNQSPAAARQLASVAARMLKAGGLGVKVESGGVAHTAERWTSISTSQDPWDLYEGFVALVRGPEFYYTCGMHNFGLPDSSIGLIDLEIAVQTLNIFNIYQLTESPPLKSGETFSIAEDAPHFSLAHSSFGLYEEEDVFYNQFGRWHLGAVSGG